MVGLLDLKGLPSIITQQAHRKPHMRLLVVEMFNSIIGHSLFTKDAIFLELMQRWNGFLNEKKIEQYREEAKEIKAYMMVSTVHKYYYYCYYLMFISLRKDLLGDRGVLIMPTFHSSALSFHTTLFNITGIDSLLLFNILGFPATHVPMGLTLEGMPIGFQVIAAPYQDKLCLQIAAAMEAAFHGWVPPRLHRIPSVACKK